MSPGDEAKRPHNETFVRLGRSVWFTLEHSQRARGAGSQLDEGLSHAKKENDEISRMGLSWMGVGDFEKRREWSTQEWIAFLRSWQHKANCVFVGHATPEEQKLINMYTIYFTYYACLPNEPEGFRPEGHNMAKALQDVDEQLDEFKERLGDPMLQCNRCKKCALGRKLMRCSRCQLAYYCDVECQKKDWKKHKKLCCPVEKQC